MVRGNGQVNAVDSNAGFAVMFGERDQLQFVVRQVRSRGHGLPLARQVPRRKGHIAYKDNSNCIQCVRFSNLNAIFQCEIRANHST